MNEVPSAQLATAGYRRLPPATAGYRRLPPVYRRATAGYRRLPPAIWTSRDFCTILLAGLGVFNGVLDFAHNYILNNFLEIQYAFPYVFQELVHFCIKIVISKI